MSTANQTIEAGRVTIRASASFDKPFVLCNLAATTIACAGLLGDSAATIIGAMLVATLMGPIMGIGLALVDFDNRLLRNSLTALAGGALLVLGVAALVGAIAPHGAPTGEMLSRTSPRMLDLIVAFASGSIAAYAVASPRLSAAIVGVSIAVALVPPLATAGMFMAHSEWDLARGAFLLAFVNMVAIQAGASTALWLCGYRGAAVSQRIGSGSLLRRQAVSILLMLTLVALLGTHAVRLLAQQRYETEVRRVVLAALAKRPGAVLNELTFTPHSSPPVVIAVVRSPASFTRAEVAEIGRQLPPTQDGSASQIRVRRIAVDVETESLN